MDALLVEIPMPLHICSLNYLHITHNTIFMNSYNSIVLSWISFLPNKWLYQTGHYNPPGTFSKSRVTAKKERKASTPSRLIHQIPVTIARPESHWPSSILPQRTGSSPMGVARLTFRRARHVTPASAAANSSFTRATCRLYIAPVL